MLFRSAYLIDLAIQLGVVLIAMSIVNILQVVLEPTTYIMLMLPVLRFAMVWLYMTLFEALWRGQTPGKRIIGLRVICEGGATAGFLEIAIRNVLRVVDSLPLGYLVGIVSIFMSSRHQRVGDMIAGTLVVRTHVRARTVELSKLVEVHDSSVSASAQERLGLSASQAEAIAGYLSRYGQFLPESRIELAHQLATPVRQHLASKPALEARIQPQAIDDITLLHRVLELYHYPALLDSPGPANPANPANPATPANPAGPPAGGERR